MGHHRLQRLIQVVRYSNTHAQLMPQPEVQGGSINRGIISTREFGGKSCVKGWGQIDFGLCLVPIPQGLWATRGPLKRQGLGANTNLLIFLPQRGHQDTSIPESPALFDRPLPRESEGREQKPRILYFLPRKYRMIYINWGCWEKRFPLRASCLEVDGCLLNW